MIKKKGKLLTTLFALVPGAGQMYMGFMKLGLSLMSIFVAILFIADFVNSSAFLFLLPIVWCYAFFDAVNKNSLSDEEFYSLEDHPCISSDTIAYAKRIVNGKEKQGVAIALILIGIDILWKNFFWLISVFVPGWIYGHIYGLIYRFPQVLIGCVVLYIGISIVYKKKKELLEEEENGEEE